MLSARLLGLLDQRGQRRGRSGRSLRGAVGLGGLLAHLLGGDQRCRVGGLLARGLGVLEALAGVGDVLAGSGDVLLREVDFGGQLGCLFAGALGLVAGLTRLRNVAGEGLGLRPQRGGALGERSADLLDALHELRDLLAQRRLVVDVLRARRAGRGAVSVEGLGGVLQRLVLSAQVG